MKIIAKLVHELRNQKNSWTQKELAIRRGLIWKTIQRIEKKAFRIFFQSSRKH